MLADEALDSDDDSSDEEEDEEEVVKVRSGSEAMRAMSGDGGGDSKAADAADGADGADGAGITDEAAERISDLSSKIVTLQEQLEKAGEEVRYGGLMRLQLYTRVH